MTPRNNLTKYAVPDAPCFVTATIFTKNLAELKKRRTNWKKWIKSNGNEMLRAQFKFGKIGWQAYGQGLVMTINRPLQRDGTHKPVTVSFPKGVKGLVPKGITVRLDMLEVLNQLDQISCLTRNDAVYAFIDGSGAFKFESLALVLNALLENEETDIAFGRRPKGNCGMPHWRKAIEEFEQYLLVRYWGDGLNKSFPGFDASRGLLPDGQAGCWAFRLRAAKKLALTGRHYEIELDLLLSSIAAGLRIAFSKPLLMSNVERTSEASSGLVTSATSQQNIGVTVSLNEDQVAMHLSKLKFIKHKLDLNPSAIIEAKREFSKRFRNTLVKHIPKDYWKVVDALC